MFQDLSTPKRTFEGFGLSPDNIAWRVTEKGSVFGRKSADSDPLTEGLGEMHYGVGTKPPRPTCVHRLGNDGTLTVRFLPIRAIRLMSASDPKRILSVCTALVVPHSLHEAIAASAFRWPSCPGVLAPGFRDGDKAAPLER